MKMQLDGETVSGLTQLCRFFQNRDVATTVVLENRDIRHCDPCANAKYLIPIVLLYQAVIHSELKRFIDMDLSNFLKATKRAGFRVLTVLIASAFLTTPTILVDPVVAAGAAKVPEGNRYKRQPKIPYSSARRTAAEKSNYDAKFQKIVSLMKRDRRLIGRIKSVAGKYGIDPIHMIGAIVGEHTYNYNSLDSLQSYYMKALAYSGVDIAFEYDGEHVNEFVTRSEFSSCAKHTSSNKLWNCRERVWDKKFRGKRVDGKRYPKKRFDAVFFHPLYAGQSFGLGQLNPLTILKMSDLVSKRSGFKKLDAANAVAVYKSAMDPNVSLHYTAAVLLDAITAYKSVARYDISGNPGLTATLYNLGDPWSRAYAARRRGGYPRENYYGWLINNRIEELRALL